MAERLLSTFKFEVKLRRSVEIEAGSNASVNPNASSSGDLLTNGGFQECSGLEVEMDVVYTYSPQRPVRADFSCRGCTTCTHRPQIGCALLTL